MCWVSVLFWVSSLSRNNHHSFISLLEVHGGYSEESNITFPTVHRELVYVLFVHPTMQQCLPFDIRLGIFNGSTTQYILHRLPLAYRSKMADDPGCYRVNPEMTYGPPSL